MTGSEPNQYSTNSTSNALHRLALSRPILVCIAIFLIAVVIRLIDSIVLRLDELLGELILTKALGFGLVLAFVWLVGRKVRDIGLHSDRLGQNLLIGTVTTVFAFIIGYTVEILIASRQGPISVSFGAIDPKLGVTGGFMFALWLVGCNFVNSFMEEGLFRGLMIPLFRIKLSFWQTNWLQAILFGAWHLPWVIKYLIIGEIQTGGEIATSMLFNSIPQMLIGLVWGYFYLKTNSLWPCWISHTIANSTSNLLHVASVQGLNSGLPIRMSTYMIVMLLLIPLVKRLTARYQMPEVEPWK